MKADEPETDSSLTLQKLVKRVEEVELENRQLKKRIQELERKNKRYTAPHSREASKEDPKPRLGQSGTPLANSSSVLKWVTLSAPKGLNGEHIEMFCCVQYNK